MTIRFKKMALASALLVSTTVTFTATFADDIQKGTDNLGVDFYQQNDFYANAQNKPRSTSAFYEEQVSWMLENEYPPASIIMSSVSRGMTLPDTAFFMSRARPEQAQEIYNLAMDIMPVLPGWACSTENGMSNRYDRSIDPQELPAEPSLQQLASLYFDEGKRFTEYPQWQENKGHADISVDELIQLKEEEMETAGGDSWWYRQDKRVKTDVTMVSLYPTERRVVIDARHEALALMKQQGTQKVPVMILYAEEGQIPVSDLARAPKESDTNETAADNASAKGTEELISLEKVISRFDSTGERVSPTRDWHKGDHHLQVQTDELQNLFDIPPRDEVPAADWQRWEKQLDEGSGKPLLVSLYQGAGDDRWLDDKGLVAVAADKGVQQLPVVFFYHSNQRQVCGLPASCSDQLQQAVEQGSGRDGLFANASSPPVTGSMNLLGSPGGSDLPASPN